MLSLNWAGWQLWEYLLAWSVPVILRRKEMRNPKAKMCWERMVRGAPAQQELEEQMQIFACLMESLCAPE